jgi:hypothetical protein
LTLTNVTISSASGLAANTVAYANASGVLGGSANMTFDGTKLTLANDASISGLTVGKGGGAVASNTALGVNSLSNNTSGSANSAFSNNALGLNTTGNYNSAFGGTDGVIQSALGKNTTGSNNAAFGNGALASNTTGNFNFGGGFQALNANTTASNNTAVGYQAGYSASTYGQNTFMGCQSGYSTTSGAYNVAMGSNSLYSAAGSYNVAIGYNAGYNATSASNTFIGQGAGYYVTSGAKNTVLGNYNGNQGGLDIRTASNYIVLSDGDGNPYFYMNQGVFTGATLKAVGNDQQLTLTSTAAAYSSRINLLSAGSGGSVLFGTSNVTVIANANGVFLNTNATSWSAISDERTKDIIEPIADATNKVSSLRAVIGKYKTDQDGIRRSFLIAQDVQAVLPEAVVAQQDKIGTLSLAYTDVIPLLVAAIQELNAKVTALEAGAKA